MYIAPRVSLVQFIVDGIAIVLNRDEANELKRTPRFASAQIKPLRKASKGQSHARTLPSPVRVIPVSEYVAQM